MAKDKIKGPKGATNKHIHARISYLHQAATYPSLQAQRGSDTNEGKTSVDHIIGEEDKTSEAVTAQAVDVVTKDQSRKGRDSEVEAPGPQNAFNQPAAGGLPLQLLAHMRAVALKSTIRLTPQVKHSLCKRCNSLLIEGQTSSKRIENASKGGRKPWADVLVVECGVCGAVKRWPVGAKRQGRKGQRAGKTVEGEVDTAATTCHAHRQADEALPEGGHIIGFGRSAAGSLARDL